MPQAIYFTREIREIEEKAGELPLMERAGAAAADMATELCIGKDVLVLAGPGNNGGDARIAAARLEEKFFRVTVATNPHELPLEKTWGLVVDGLFGIGLARNVTGEYAQLVEYANRQRCPVLALDVPSGIQSDTGQMLGCAVRASHTSLIALRRPAATTARPLRRAARPDSGSLFEGKAWVEDRGSSAACSAAPRNSTRARRVARHLAGARPTGSIARRFARAQAGRGRVTSAAGGSSVDRGAGADAPHATCGQTSTRWEGRERGRKSTWRVVAQ